MNPTASPKRHNDSVGISQSPHLLIFVDGLGLGQNQADNPLADAQTMPYLTDLLGAPLLAGLTVAAQGPDRSLKRSSKQGVKQNVRPSRRRDNALGDNALCFQPIDACLGVPGLPQSATGQTTLYTGHNAAQFRGRHQSAFANGSLRQLIEPYSIFRQVMALGLTATQANAYLPGYFDAIAQRRRRYAVGALLNLTAPLPFRTLEDYQRGEAVYWDITGEIVERYHGVPAISAAEAGRRLVQLAKVHHVTLFETFMPDYAGHHQNRTEAIAALQRIDALLEAIIRQKPDQLTVILTSDHGNVEDLSTSHHTLNAVPLLTVGPGAQQLAGVKDLTGITPAILHSLRG